MAIEDKPEEVDRYLAENQDIRQWKTIEQERDRQLQRDLKKLDIDGQIEIKKLEAKAATMRLKATSRIEVWRRVLVGLVKLPILPLVILIVWSLELLKREPIEALDDFIDI